MVYKNFYIVATPIGNLKDITMRAVEVLQNVDIIFCEDTRVTKVLLDNFSISKKLYKYNDFSSEADRQNIVELLKKNELALVSDAGCPLISDPGFKLIRLLKELDINIIPIPGASALTTALMTSPIPINNFYFGGFLTGTNNQIFKRIEEYRKIKSSLVFFVASNEIKKVLLLLKDLYQDKIYIAKELTKLFENLIFNSIENILDLFNNDKNLEKGEFVIILPSYEDLNVNYLEIMKDISYLSDKLSNKDLKDFLSNKYGISKKEIYKLLLNN